MTVKHLVCSGDSFTNEAAEKTWATHLSNHYNIEKHNYARSSMGNGLIARTVAYGVSKLLQQGVPNEDILVGVMWSFDSRTDFFVDETPHMEVKKDSILPGQNPYSFVEGAPGTWVIGSANWETPIIKKYYENFYSKEGQTIYTLEKVLWLQDFLKLRGIKYFMSAVMDRWVNSRLTQNTNWMYKEIKDQHILPSEFEYLHRTNTDALEKVFRKTDMDRWPIHTWNEGFRPGWHPNETGHKKYTEEVIVPHLRRYKL